jgi:hypothetical protein
MQLTPVIWALSKPPMNKIFLSLAFLSVFLFSCSDKDAWKSKVQDPEFLHRSVKQVTDVIVHDIFSPPVASRIYAYMSVAGYEACIPQNPKYISLAGQLNGLEPLPKPEDGKVYCYQLASVEAMLKVGRTLVFSDDKMEFFYAGIMQEFKDTDMPEDVFERSVAYGDQVAAHVLAWSGKDNYKQSRSFPKYTIQNDEYSWKPTPPAYMDAIEPHWNKIRTFAIDSAAQFKPAQPTEFSTDKNSQFYKEANEVREMGINLSEEQRQIASFWDCNPFVMNVKGHVMFATKKISPGGHWMNITHVACRKAKADFAQSAEAYVRVAVSLVDGFISCWDEKFRSKVIRPETYINQHIDEAWTPLLQTPPFPEYTSGHSVISSSSAVALTKLFGDNFAFSDSTEIEFGMPARNFTSFMQASEEAAISRMYGGIHYRPACDNGIKEGRALGNYIADKLKTRKESLAEAN